jgi:hypothetical protein
VLTHCYLRPNKVQFSPNYIKVSNMPSRILLPTNKLYESADFGDFQNATQHHLAETFEDYNVKSSAEKWTIIMDSFSNTENLSPEQKRCFDNFKANRLNSAEENRFILTMDQALIYFESYHFLYNDKESSFKLTSEKGTALLQDILEGMSPGICEPGKFTHFENTLQRARSDLNNWVLSELSKQCSTLIQTLAEQYNTEKNIGDAFSIHTVMHMNRLAHTRGLGVEETTQVEDAYLTTNNVSKITDYFDKHSLKKFEQYENESISNLSQYAMMTVRDWLTDKNVDVSNWDDGTIRLIDQTTNDRLSPDEQAELQKLIQSILSIEASEMPDLVDFDDDYNLVLFERPTFFKKFEEKIEQKLINENYIVPLSALHKNHPQIENIRLPDCIELSEFLKFLDYNVNVQSELNCVELITSNINLIRKHPTLLLSLLTENPGLWSKLPRKITADIHIQDNLLSALDSSMLFHDSTMDENCFNLLLNISQSNPALINQLPEEVLNNPSFGLRLVQKNGLLLATLSEDLRADDDIVSAAIQQNELADVYIYSDVQNQLNIDRVDQKTQEIQWVSSWRTSRKLSFDLNLWQNYLSENIEVFEEPIQSLPSLFIKATAIKTLLTQETISTGQTIKLVEQISPEEFNEVIQSRAERRLKPLPYASPNQLKSFLSAFDEEFSCEGHFINLKRELSNNSISPTNHTYLSADYCKAQAQKEMVHSHHWYFAFIAYQKKLPGLNTSFKSLEDVISQLNITIKALIEIPAIFFRFIVNTINTLLVPSLFCALYLYLNPLLDNLITQTTALIISNVGVVLGFALPMLLLGYAIGKKFGVPSPITYILMSSLAAVGMLFPELALFTASLYPAYLILKGVLMLGGFFTGRPYNWVETTVLFWSALIGYLLAFETLVLKSIPVFIELFGTISQSINLLINGLIPWLSRTWASIFDSNQPLSKEEALVQKVEECIIRLQLSDEPSAEHKGNLLESLWQKIKLNPESLEKGLSEKMDVEGYNEPMSFWEVAKTTRTNKESFTPKAPDTRLSFFGLRGNTTTAKQLEQVAPSGIPSF